MGCSTSTFLRVTNYTFWDITKIDVDVDNSGDWGSGSRPFQNFKGETIKPNSYLQGAVDLHKYRGWGHFKMTLTFSNKSVDVFSVNQRYALKGYHEHNFKHTIRNHDIFFGYENDDTLIIIIKSTAKQIEDHIRDELKKQVQKILNEANKLLANQQYEEALVEFEKALEIIDREKRKLGNELSLIQKLKDGKTECLLQLLKKQIEELLNEGNKLLANLNYKQALVEFEAACKIINENEDALANELKLIQKVKKGKTDCCLQLGKIAMDNAGKLEKQLQSSEAMKEFELAKSYFEKVQKLGVDCKLNIDVLSAKIDGSKIFNEAVDLDEAGLNLYKKNHSSQDNKIVANIKSKYEQALNKYEQAKKLFEQGYQLNEELFAESLKIVNVAINEVQKSLTAAASNQLLINLTNMYLKDNENEKTVVNQEEEEEEEEEEKKEEEGMVMINKRIE